MSEDFQTVFGHDEGVLPLGGGQFVLGDNGPVVFFVNEYLPAAALLKNSPGVYFWKPFY